jgi:RNA polymerase sigma-70 factor (family 1)
MGKKGLMSQWAEAQLLRELKNGSVEAFEELYGCHWRSLYTFLCQKVTSEDAQDILQEVFVALWVGRERLVIEKSLTAYLFTTAKYKVFDLVRARLNAQKAMALLLRPGSGEATVAAQDPLQAEEFASSVELAIESLPEKMREVFLLSRRDELPLKSIAQQLNLSEQTVKNQITEALKRLRSKLISSYWLIAFLLN